VPQITADLAPGSAELLWIIDVYGFILAGLLIPMGSLGDRIGRRRLLLAGGTAFALASLLAALAEDAMMLIATRALLGVAGATLMPSTLALIRTMFLDPQQRTVAVSVWMMGFMVGGAIGPLAGGALLEWFDWRAIFVLPIPVMLTLVVFGRILLPEYRDPSPGRLDPAGVVLSLTAVLSFIHAVKQAAEGTFDAPAVGFLGLALGAGVAFVRRQRHVDVPLVDLTLFRRPTFVAALAANTVSVLVMMGVFLFTAQYLQLVRGLAPIEAGLWLLPQTAAFLVGSMAAPAVAARVPAPRLLSVGLGVAALGFALVAMAGRDGFGLLIAGTVVSGLGLAPVFSLGTDLILSAASPERAGAASALSETGSELGGALGIAVLGSVGTAVYRSEFAESAPEGLPAAAAATARDTLGGAVGVAGDLPGPLAGATLDAAVAAFTAGLQTSAVLAAVLAAALAIVVAAVVRGSAPGRPDPAPEARRTAAAGT
jgi:DHA2 family multidrug resistance protein-like MFS transporter